MTGESPVRREWNADRVAKLVVAGRLILPILVTADLRPGDGAYRLAAARQLGWESIDALIVDAPDEAARIAAACQVNEVERLSRAERRLAAMRLLELEPAWSDRRVARITGTSPTSVGAWRSKVDTSGVQMDTSHVHLEFCCPPIRRSPVRLQGELLSAYKEFRLTIDKLSLPDLIPPQSHGSNRAGSTAILVSQSWRRRSA